jgi:hypothetical protein
VFDVPSQCVGGCEQREMKRAGSPRGIAPPGLPQIQTCGFPASGSSCRSSSLCCIRCSSVDTIRGTRPSACSRTSNLRHGVPFSPRGSGGPVPPVQRYYGTLRLPTVHFAALRCLRLAIPPVASCLLPTIATHDRGHRGVVGSGLPSRNSRWKRSGLPGSWGTLMIIVRALRPR